ncbi:MAG TPA: hypothetical protein VF533_16305 [Solirubrobacteraceae bacterium]|jgi:hypothetical protein
MATYSTVRERPSYAGGAGLAAARAVGLVTAVVAGIIVVGILLVLLEASKGNDLVGVVLDAARWLTTPFHGIFDLSSAKWQTALNWGLAALVYTLVGRLIARLLAR